jgi:hypothetical protein
MSGYKKAKRHSSRRLSPKAQEGGGRRAGWSPRFRDAVAVAVALAILIPIAVLGLSRSDEPQPPPANSGMAGSTAASKTAAIVDQLGLTQPNLSFVQTATATLEQAGYTVDYYPAEQVTVDFYRTLPERGYEFLVLRVHSAVPSPLLKEAIEALSNDVFLFTSEPYSPTSHTEEQKKLLLFSVGYLPEYGQGDARYFGISPDFIKSGMRGGFGKATVIMMGCDGLASDDTAAAFVQKGARSVVSWDGPVSASHTDLATERLLEHLLVDGSAMPKAVAQTMTDVGPDPAYGSSLRLYPPDSAASGAYRAP